MHVVPRSIKIRAGALTATSPGCAGTAPGHAGHESCGVKVEGCHCWILLSYCGAETLSDTGPQQENFLPEARKDSLADGELACTARKHGCEKKWLGKMAGTWVWE